MDNHESKIKKFKQTASSNPADGKLPTLNIESRFTTGRIILLFVALTMIFTFPMVLRMDGWIMGDIRHYGSDIIAAIWQFWSAKVQLLELFWLPVHRHDSANRNNSCG